MKRIKQTGKEIALEMFKWQIRFLPMPKKEQDKQVELFRQGLDNTLEQKNVKPK